MSSIASAITSATKELAKAKNEFPSATKTPAAKTPSVTDRIGTSLRDAAKKMSAASAENSKEADDVASGLKENAEQAKVARASAPKYHKGGKIKKDGEQVINAEKGETILPNHDIKRVKELAMDHLKGMADAMSKKEEHEKHKTHKPKRHGKVKVMHVHKADDDTYVIHHEHEPNEDGSSNPNTTHTAQDMDELHDHMEEHMGEPEQGEAEADAGVHGVPDAQAGPAGLPMQGGQNG